MQEASRHELTAEMSIISVPRTLSIILQIALHKYCYSPGDVDLWKVGRYLDGCSVLFTQANHELIKRVYQGMQSVIMRVTRVVCFYPSSDVHVGNLISLPIPPLHQGSPSSPPSVKDEGNEAPV